MIDLRLQLTLHPFDDALNPLGEVVHDRGLSRVLVGVGMDEMGGILLDLLDLLADHRDNLLFEVLGRVSNVLGGVGQGGAGSVPRIAQGVGQVAFCRVGLGRVAFAGGGILAAGFLVRCARRLHRVGGYQRRAVRRRVGELRGWVWFGQFGRCRGDLGHGDLTWCSDGRRESGEPSAIRSRRMAAAHRAAGRPSRGRWPCLRWLIRSRMAGGCRR